jgi:hypothetical protein
VSKITLAGLSDKLSASMSGREPDSEGSIYILYYKTNITSTNFKFFIFDGDARSAADRAKRHCKVLGLRFVGVAPLISDLALEEKEHTSSAGDAFAAPRVTTVEAANALARSGDTTL